MIGRREKGIFRFVFAAQVLGKMKINLISLHLFLSPLTQFEKEGLWLNIYQSSGIK